MDKARDLITALGQAVSSSVEVTGAVRLTARYTNRPGIVKISFRTLAEKISVLRNKMTLKDSGTYSRVYLKSSKSHAERLIELNARAILRELPQGSNLRLDANGRIKRRPAPPEDTQIGGR